MNQYPQGIPDGILREDVVKAVRDFDTGADHDFGPSTFYDLLFEGRRYPPKAIVGLAARRLAGRVLRHDEFKGGDSSKCFKVLRDLDFLIVPKETSVTNTSTLQEARKTVEGLLPDAEHREAVARLFAKAILVAHPMNPGGWALTFDQQRQAITLDVGRVFALSLNGDGLSALLSKDELAVVAGNLPEWGQREPDEEFASLPSATWRRGPVDEVLSWWHQLEDIHLSALREAAQQLKRSTWAKHHRAELVQLVAELAGEDLPQPDYGSMTLRKKSELRSLFAEFLEVYPKNKGWQFHLDVIPRSRDEARASFASIRGLAESGEDVTDEVLNKLLPYADSTKNREKGAWISVAPVINGDIKMWFENAGWAKAEDWPQVARLILDFLIACDDDPSQLESACRRLVEALPCKGIQAAILSPMLNALRPDDFIIFNKKSRLTVNYFAGAKLTTSLGDYPAANSLELGIIDEVSEMLDDAGILEGLYRTDRFDMFCHWLVAVKKFGFSGVRSWKIAPGEQAWNWDACRENGYIAMGWDELGDLSSITREEFDARNAQAAAAHEDWSEDGARQAWTFAREITEGDRVIANRGTSEVLGIGTVVGPYQFVPDVRHGHRLPVEWEDVQPRKVQFGGWRRTLIELTESDMQKILVGTVEKPKGDGVFTARSFELLSLLNEKPEKAVYDAHKEEFAEFVEGPFRSLMAEVASRLRPEITDVMETEKRIFSRIPKNDYGRGGAWPFYWGAFYPRGGKRTEDAQLYFSIMHHGLDFGFYFGEYGGEQRHRFVSNCSRLRPALDRVFHDFVDSGDFVYGRRQGAVEPGEMMVSEPKDWRGWISSLDEESIRVSVPVNRDDALQLERSDLVRMIVETFERVFPLVYLATVEDPMPLIGSYVDIDTEPETELNPEYSLSVIAEETGFEEDTLRRWVNAINRKNQAVFFGPPGTGKTFVAEKMAKHLVGGSDGFWEIVQFHPAYAYEDFMQGIRPKTRPDGSFEYRMEPGRFLSFCAEARTRTGTCVLIVDEINRANLARVFGELMYLLEYRDHEVPLAGGGRLKIPGNVRLIGTMNTADRSIALVDHALRRRFAFISLYPQYDVLKKFHKERGYDAAKLVELLKSVNSAIDDPHYEVGISFFLKDDLEEHLEDIWGMEIEPYLEEYFFDQRTKVGEFLWDKVFEKLK